MDDLPRNLTYRILEAMPGITTWIILTVPFLVAFWYPRGVAIFVTTYVLFWFLRSIKSSIYLIHGFYKQKHFVGMDWHKLLRFFSDNPPAHAQTKIEQETALKADYLKSRGLFKKWDNIYHVVIIATYKEEKEILDSTIDAISQIKYPLNKLILVLATEERDNKRAQENADYLLKKYGKTFHQFHHYMHPANRPNEIQGKGANISYAGEKIAAELKRQGIDFSSVLVTTLDADNRPHPTYFSNLTYHYLMEENRQRRSYQPLPFLYNNIWDVPFANRLIAIANTFWYISESGEPYHLRNASAHAQSLDTLYKLDFWSKHTITEDSHQFWRTYFHFNGDHEVVPLFVPVYQDALQSRTYFTSLLGQYTQLRRWAWGASDIPYVIIKMWKQRRSLPFWQSFSNLIYLIWGQIMWSTAPIIIFFNKSIPTVLNPKFSNSLFAYNLGYILNIIFTAIFLIILVSLTISFISLPRKQGKLAKLHLVSSVLQWVLLPFVTILYGAIPAIDAQTRLMFGKQLGFTVTEKIRKIGGEE